LWSARQRRWRPWETETVTRKSATAEAPVIEVHR
jgi:hypothetical protein